MDAETRRVVHSSNSVEWHTPPEVFAALNKEFDFVLDPAATNENALCFYYYTEETDGLAQSWGIYNSKGKAGNVYCNPPYGRGITALWVKKAKAEAIFHGITVVMLLPSRTGTKWFHNHVWDYQNHRPQKGVEVRFWKGRMKFGGTAGNDSAPFDSVIVVFDGRKMSEIA